MCNQGTARQAQGCKRCRQSINPVLLPVLCAVRQVDEDMMQELKDIKANIKPSDTLLVVDAMTGQVRGWGGMG